MQVAIYYLYKKKAFVIKIMVSSKNCNVQFTTSPFSLFSTISTSIFSLMSTIVNAYECYAIFTTFYEFKHKTATDGSKSGNIFL